MAVQAGVTFNGRIAVLIVSTAFNPLVLVPATTQAQQAITLQSAAATTFTIPAQRLDLAVSAFIRQSGWQVGYATTLLANKQSVAISGRLDPLAALQGLLAGSGISVRVTGPTTVTLVNGAEGSSEADGSTALATIVVKSARSGVSLGTDSAADTGTSVVSGGQIVARSEGNDANGILRNLPNIQYQNDIDDDAGTTDQTVIDTRPREVSISGARVYENNFIINGMEINTITGTEERDPSKDTLTDSETPPTESLFYGAHSQTIYVPADFLQSATVIDSNASARYGNFQGGVVSYELADAAKERWKGSVSTDYTTSNWTGFTLGTEDGLNPNDVARNDYIKRRAAVSLSGPVTDNVSALFQYSRETAVTSKDKAYRYTEADRVNEDSQNDFYRGQVKAETDYGDFTLEGIYTHYDQYWENSKWRNMQVNVAARGFTSKLQHDYEFEDFSLGGIALSNVKLTSKLNYGSSESLNDMNGNVARAYKQTYVTSKVVRWTSTELTDWCRTDTTLTVSQICYDGATGDKQQGQEQVGWSQEMTGDIWQGTFRLGGDYTYTDAYRRRPEEATYYGVYNTYYQAAYTCASTEECSPEQFASNKSIYRAFDISAQLNAFNAYAELDQTWDWINVRAGLRATYDDYMQNLDFAPRFVTTITPWEDFSISLGANRYYNAQSLAFAIRDQQPRTLTYTRKVTNGVVDDTWTAAGKTGYYTNSASDLDTPYTDELTFGVSGVEPLFGGQWRIRFLDRKSKKQYAAEEGTSDNYVLTNNGHGGYQSATAEYSKELQTPAIAALDELTFNASVTWSKSEVSNDSYFAEDLEDDHIWYRNKSYTKAGFNVVTGNMDIPLRFQTGLSSAWFDSALRVDLNANYNFGYTGVKDTDENITVDGINHEIWEDFDFSPTLTVDLAASYRVYSKGDNGLTVNVKVNNLFNETGNATASTSNPWLMGRTVWVGAKATF